LHGRAAQRIHWAVFDADRIFVPFPASIAVEGNSLFGMHGGSRRVEAARRNAAPTADAVILVDVDDSPVALDPPGSVPQRAGKVALGKNALLAHGEAEVIGEGITVNL
jgi:hypothetical protein